MAEYKPNWRFWFITLLNFTFVAMCGYAVKFAFENEIEFGVEYEGMTEEPLIIAFAVVGCCYVISSLVIVWHLIRNKGNVMTITGEGVRNGLFIANVACLFIILPVKFIPWQAITEVEDEHRGVFTARIDTSKVRANPLTKLMLKIMGYNFCSGLTNIYREDIMMFSDLFTVKSSLQR